MIVGFTGTRHGMTQWQHEHVLAFLMKERPAYAHHGMCVGADAEFDALCASLRIQRVGHPSNIPSMTAPCPGMIMKFNPRPPLERNRLLVSTVDYMLCCPFEKAEIVRSGTWATIRYAREIHKKRSIFPGRG